MFLAGIWGIVLGLGLALAVCAAEYQVQDPHASDASPTPLESPMRAGRQADGLAIAPVRGTTDSAASPVLYQPVFPVTRISAGTEQPPTSLVPLPLMGAQAAPAQAKAQRRGQQQPAAATAAPRQASPARPPQPRQAAAGPQPQQDIQFDPNGLVTHFHVNEGDLRQILELLSRRARMNILVSPKVGGTVTRQLRRSDRRPKFSPL